jgi:hypothetical protein
MGELRIPNEEPNEWGKIGVQREIEELDGCKSLKVKVRLVRRRP